MNKIKTTLTRLLLIAASLVVMACGGSNKETNDLADAQPYKPESPHKAVLNKCATTNRNFCTLRTLPLLGMEYSSPGIPQIMDRVLVSHAWMGERFEELLYELPEAMLPLFKGVTAIVIDADIRPAYYSPGTGAIYLDPAFLWLTVEEKHSINPKQDYRAGFDDPLAFRYLNRYLVDGQPAYVWGSLNDNSTREQEDILLLVGALLLHELAHANDLIPPDTYDLINTNHTVLQITTENDALWLSTQLTTNSPLESMIMYNLGEVMYHGDTPLPADLEITATGAGTEFEPDGAADHYAYSSQREDFAMLFETAMMKFFFNADYELAFTSVPQNASRCDNYLIGWGVRNRIGDSQVKERARLSANTLLPQVELSEFFDTLESPTEFSGDWCLTPPPTSAYPEKPSKPSRVDPVDRLRPYL